MLSARALAVLYRFSRILLRLSAGGSPVRRPIVGTFWPTSVTVERGHAGPLVALHAVVPLTALGSRDAGRFAGTPAPARGSPRAHHEQVVDEDAVTGLVVQPAFTTTTGRRASPSGNTSDSDCDAGWDAARVG